MPAGKIFLAAKATKSRPRYRKRSSKFKKAVTAIAKRTIMSQTETKTNAVALNNNFGTGGILTDLWSPITTGATQANRVGDEIKALGVRVRGLFEQTPGAITANASQNGIRVMFVAGKRPLVIGDMPSMRSSVDPEVITVLKDFYINFDTTKTAKWFNFYVKMNRLVRYDPAGNAIRCPLYMYTVSDGGTGILVSSGNGYSLQIQRYWKDL